MKTLNLLRHAKSGWPDSGMSDTVMSDIDRTLNERGRQACSVMAAKLEKLTISLDYVLCSPAQRAQETAAGISAELIKPFQWQILAQLYTFDSQALLAIIAELDDDCDEVLLIGHNPALTEVANTLSDARIDNVPTCTLVSIEFSGSSWASIVAERGGDNGGHLHHFIRPLLSP